MVSCNWWSGSAWVLGAAVAMATVGVSPVASAADPEQVYEQEKIVVTTAMLSPGRNNTLVPRRFVPTKGGAGLQGAVFYEAVGRPDLAATYTKRRWTRWTLFGAGAVLIVGGTALGLAGALSTPENKGLKFGGAAVAVGGLMTVSASQIYNHFAPAHPIEPALAKNLIDEYNAGVRTQLSLGPLSAVRIGPQVSGSFAGMRVSGRF